jgi:hypothetical protein
MPDSLAPHRCATSSVCASWHEPRDNVKVCFGSRLACRQRVLSGQEQTMVATMDRTWAGGTSCRQPTR